MARPSSSDTRYLEQKNGKWRVTLAVPRHLQSKLGTRRKKELHTDSLAVANRMKWQVVAELRAEIGNVANPYQPARDALTREAFELVS